MRINFKAIGAASLVLAACGGSTQAQVETRPPITPYKPAFAGQTRAPEQKLGVGYQTTVVATGLKNPWSLAFLPDGRMLVTERTLGNLRIVAKDGTLSALSGTTAVFNLCGLGSNCAIAGGTPSTDRLLLLRREALELALYTFRYVHNVDNVVSILPPGRTQAVTTAKLADGSVTTARPSLRARASSVSRTAALSSRRGS